MNNEEESSAESKTQKQKPDEAMITTEDIENIAIMVKALCKEAEIIYKLAHIAREPEWGWIDCCPYCGEAGHKEYRYKDIPLVLCPKVPQNKIYGYVFGGG